MIWLDAAGLEASEASLFNNQLSEQVAVDNCLWVFGVVAQLGKQRALRYARVRLNTLAGSSSS
jgi:hypothetical protein